MVMTALIVGLLLFAVVLAFWLVSWAVGTVGPAARRRRALALVEGQTMAARQEVQRIARTAQMQMIQVVVAGTSARDRQ